MGSQKNKIQEDAFRAQYDSKIGRKLRTKKEGEPMIGRGTANDEFINYMQGKTPGRFRDLPSITAMRNRANERKAQMTSRETPEQYARRQRKARGY